MNGTLSLACEGGRFNISLAGLRKGCAYTVKIRATNEAGSSNYSAAVTDTAYGEANPTPLHPEP